jgi:hypothetical protein
MTWPGAACLVLALASCGTTTPGGVATNPAAGPTRSSPGAAGGPGILTVLTPLGVNVHATPATDGQRVGNASQGTLFTVVDRDTAHGGWYRVQGASATGWVSASSTLVSPRRFLTFPTDAHDFSALYLDTWTFSAQPGVVVFRPQGGGQSGMPSGAPGGTPAIAVTTAANEAGLGPAGRAGYRVTTFDTMEVCGVTTTIRTYDRAGTPAPPVTPTPAPIAGLPPPTAAAGIPPASAASVLPALGHLAELHVPVDATHVLSLDFAYDDVGRLADFADFYNSISFPSPLCLGAPATPAAGAPAAPAPVAP